MTTPTPPSAMEEARKIVTMHQHLHGGRRGDQPLSCPSCRPLVEAIARALSERDEEKKAVLQVNHSLGDMVRAREAQLRERERECAEGSHGAWEDVYSRLIQEVERLRAGITESFKTMLHVPMCGCDHEQNDPACHVGILKALLPRMPRAVTCPFCGRTFTVSLPKGFLACRCCDRTHWRWEAPCPHRRR